jgi:hypothetical protein
MRMLTTARGAVLGLAPGKPNVEYVAMDGTLYAVPLADAARVRRDGGMAVVKSAGMTTLPTVRDTAPDLSPFRRHSPR